MPWARLEIHTSSQRTAFNLTPQASYAIALPPLHPHLSVASLQPASQPASLPISRPVSRQPDLTEKHSTSPFPLSSPLTPVEFQIPPHPPPHGSLGAESCPIALFPSLFFLLHVATRKEKEVRSTPNKSLMQGTKKRQERSGGRSSEKRRRSIGMFKGREGEVRHGEERRRLSGEGGREGRRKL